MITLSTRTFIKVAAAIGCAPLLVAATPAFANSSASAAADVTEPVRVAEDETLANGDGRFRELFASWSSLDSVKTPQPGVPASIFEQPTVSVPSRMPLNTGRISSSYGMRTHPVLRKRRAHKGIDLAAPTGTPVYATADGLVGRADWFSSYGLYISIDHGADLETRYAHLSRLAVAAGDTVRKGDVIGYVGSTGRSTGPHLHYEVRVDGVAVNPIPYMQETEAQTRLAETQSDMIPGRRRVGAGGQ
ncbi:M23 family metallopeptidase [Erythrobacter sp.]|jgi:murein DD-endopeptidase MepM/ murein hydrolase activator NlpD|uniref:M23 family metallopeptidase n=1 Tax=Erythrobacter sp. TaxID=1042 RepID=UPI002EC974B6|nr:M23 family metallopeptidase [Erythrobacter sp.]